MNKQVLFRSLIAADDTTNYTFALGGLTANGGTANLGGYHVKMGGGPTDWTRTTKDGIREIISPDLPAPAENVWHDVEVIAEGNRFRMLVDGREASAFEDTESRLRRGRIAFRLRKDANVEIRAIRIKELNRKP